MIWIATISLLTYFISFIMILKEKRYYDRIHAVFYAALILLLIQDINTKRYLIEGFNFYSHSIIVLYSFYSIYKHWKTENILKYNLLSAESTFIKWDMLYKMDKDEISRLNNNKIKTRLKSKSKNRIVFVSTVYQETITDKYVNDFYKKIIVKSGSCIFSLLDNGKFKKSMMCEGDSIEIKPMQEHWFVPNGETVVLEVICVK